ncbi:purine-nucleoside phosphorylase [Borrelia turcica IST7]|uniref:Purine nucleoside phosphorylase n=1 Tax=Borrelia turcica IST7 TaxID=1104446 RepID=A0A386PN97_9SPIR|nr:purine-nucleoside phosphorylase [Borrelia turcica]AYE36585.1 purine-nucleoside phosphorylase [Borrelia turcica IST7]
MNFKEINKRIDKAYDSIKDKSEFKPKTAIILGSGLSDLNSICEHGIEIPYRDIKEFPISTVDGHKGTLNINKDIAIFSGRFHYYEGYHPKEIIMPILLAKKIGIQNLIITNSSGAINSQFKINDLILINNHINFMGINPLIGTNDDNLGARFQELNSIYSNSSLVELTRNVYKNIFKENIKEGVYLAVSGPCYETTAEISFFKTIGADLVGMSTVPEVITAAYLKMNTVAISNVTNLASGMQKEPLSHEEVKINSSKISKEFEKLIKGIINTIEFN